MTFIDTDTDGISGDDPADNAVQATDASATVNNITVTSATNDLTDAIAGATISLLKKDPATTVTVTVGRDDEATKTLIDTFISEYNELTAYLDFQFTASATGDDTAIGGDSLLRGLRNGLRAALTGAYDVGGTYRYLAEVGIGSNATGELTFDKALFDTALKDAFADVQKLFLGDGTTDGAFVDLKELIESYTQSGGLLPDIQQRLDDQVLSLDDRILEFEARLVVREAALQGEFIAADLAISQLNSQIASLSSLGTQFRLF